VRAELSQELRGRALRHALWIALLHAGELGFDDLEHMLTAILVDVDQRREALDDEAGATERRQ